MKCDVLIAGAGIAGLYLARELAKQKFNVILVDQSKTPGEPNFSTAGTPWSTIETFMLPRAGIACETSVIMLATKTVSRRWEYQKSYGVTLDFRKTKQLLADEAASYGAKVLWGVKVCGVSERNDGCLVETSAESIECRYAVDDTGSYRALFRENDVKATGMMGVGLEVIMDDPRGILHQFAKSMTVYLGTGLAPHGYAWVFANGATSYKVGICEANIQKPRNLPSLDSRLQAFLAFLGLDKGVKPLEKHGGTIFYSSQPQDLVRGNILAIGDAACMLNPFAGEGIRHSLWSAKFAYDALVAHRNRGEALTHYTRAIRRYKRFSWWLTFTINGALYNKATAETERFYERFITYTKRLDNDAILAFIFDYQIVSILFDIPHNLKLFGSFLRTMG